MTARWIRCLSAALGLGLFALAAHALDVVDERGVTVSLPQPPQRIVTLLPSLTEGVCALGACSRQVGVDNYSNSPDAVLLAKSSRVTQRLEALGLKVLVLEPKSHADVRRVLDKLDQVLGTREAPNIWRAIDAGVSAAAQSLPASARGQRVYFEVNSAPYAAGESSFIGETLARLGMKNIVPASLGPFPKLNPEYVVRANPDLIMVSVRSAAGMEQRPGWSGIRAVREGRICRFDAAQSDVLVRPGPRMDEAARLMARCIAEKAG